MKKQKNCEKRYVFVFDTSTIIVLQELGRVDLIDSIRKHCNVKIIIPQAVKNEFLRSGLQPKASPLQGRGWKKRL